MESYLNYYDVQPGTEKYNLIAQDVLGMLKVITGATDLDKADLASGARSYLLAGGMKAEQIDALKAKLSTPIPVSWASAKLIMFEIGSWVEAEAQPAELVS
jgi:hypothetical protein